MYIKKNQYLYYKYLFTKNYLFILIDCKHGPNMVLTSLAKSENMNRAI